MPTRDPDERECTSAAPDEVVGTINVPILARICDDIRGTIISYRGPGSWPHLHELSGLLSAFLVDQDDPKRHISLETIRVCRLDRLIDDILEPDHHPREGEGDEEFAHMISKACKLQRTWKARFKEAYGELDEVRCQEMLTVGRLQGLRFRTEGNPKWEIAKGHEDNFATSIEPGMWFLNMVCAKRHGIEGNSLENMSINGTRVLPLLWGKEETITPDLVRYTREGTAKDMSYSFLGHVGRQSHILRSYQLRGPFSPSVGLRYDGIYNLRSFALKRDPHTGVFRMTLTGDRADGQIPLQTLRAVPRPAELDDWRLCAMIEERAMQKAGRGEEYAQWKRTENEGKTVL